VAEHESSNPKVEVQYGRQKGNGINVRFMAIDSPKLGDFYGTEASCLTILRVEVSTCSIIRPKITMDVRSLTTLILTWNIQK
jgi:hypothetical protein